MYHLAPSIIGADYNFLRKQFEIMQEEGVSYLHLDIMDGKFVPSICMDIPLIKSIRKNNSMVFDVHIMTENAGKIVREVAGAGADIISIHYETEESVMDIIRKIKKMGKKSGIIISPGTQVKEISDVLLKEIEVFQIMSVEPGVGGQKFLMDSLEKISEAARRRAKLNLKYDIKVDGDVNLKNLNAVLRAGANIIVAGTALFDGDLRENIIQFQKVIKGFESRIE